MKSDVKASSQDHDRERFTWNGRFVEPGETCDLQIAVSESYSGVAVEIPIQIQRATTSGPTVFVSAALHGDEINGTGAVRELLKDDEHSLLSGTLILVPVLNICRDLNVTRGTCRIVAISTEHFQDRHREHSQEGWLRRFLKQSFNEAISELIFIRHPSVAPIIRMFVVICRFRKSNGWHSLLGAKW